jgi:hypothetical protein
VRATFENITRKRAIAIGISTGGPATLQEVLPQIPADLPASIFLVQHMPPAFIASFAKRLDEHCALKVVEGRSGMPVEPSVCYVAPGGMHLCLHRKMTGEVVIRTPTTPATLFVPSVGVMMASVLSIYGTDTIGVLMTGIGDDGADQMVAIKQAGGHTIAESEQTAVVYGMPREAVERGGACVVAPSHEVAGEILKAVRRTIGMSSLKEYLEKLDGPDEAERIYAAEDIGYLECPGRRAASFGTVGPGAFAGGSRRNLPGSDPDRGGRVYRGFHRFARKRRSPDPQPGRGCAAPQRRALGPLPGHGHAKRRQGYEETPP